ncbi:MAG: radical SAM protein, partial [Anaerolineae bacterium]
MDCEYLPTLSLVEFGERLRKAPAPLGGGIELTHRCNLGCIHCYNRKKAGDRAARDAEMSYDTICRIVDQAAEMGCFSLYLTGGEPLLRRDFLDIYGYVISKGILTVLFTNATLITPRIADHLAEYPPLFVDISLYGRTKDVYES